jgi:NTE family protein
MSRAEWLLFLRKIPFFAGFSDDELDGVAARMTLEALPKDAVLFRQGDSGDALYIVYSGHLRVMSGENGQSRILAHVGRRGDVLGEMALLTGEPRRNTVEAESTTELLVLRRKDFEPLLRERPAMALHISRFLSRRLADVIKTKTAATAGSWSPRIHPVMSHLSLPNRVVFTVNLALALAEQTRRKVLLLDIHDQESGLFAMSLGLAPVRSGERSLRHEDLASPEVLARLTVYHPSGLELLSLPLSLIEGKFFSSIYPLLAILREVYDITLLVMPPRLSAAARAVLEESDSLIYVEKDSPSPGDAELLEGLAGFRTADQIFRVQLAEGPPSQGGPAVNFRLPWRATLGRERMEAHNVFLPDDAPLTRRLMDRLARRLGGLRIGFAMGSGAAYGYTMIGMLRVMERHGIFPDVIAGTSIGALIGAFYAAGKTPDELERIAVSITKRKMLALADFTVPWQGVLLGREVLKFLKEHLGDKTFEELDTPFACVATNIQTGEEVVLKQGKAAEAVRASLSLPFFFQPFFHQGNYLVDGGLVNPVPTSVVASLGANVLVSVNLTCRPSEKRFPGMKRSSRRYSSAYLKGPNIFQVMLKTLYTMQYEVALTRSEISHVTLTPDIAAFAWSEFHRAPEIIKVGEELMEESLPKIKALLPFYSDTCRVPLRLPAALGRY